MALIQCKECGYDVSRKADNCPNCGAMIKRHIIRKGSSIIVTILTLVMTVISIYIAKKALGISEKSLDVSKHATEISDIALKISSLNTQPIFNINVDRKNDKLTIKHDTHEIYKIKYVSFMKVRTIAVITDDSNYINGLEVLEDNIEMPLMQGRSKNVGGFSEEECKEYNKKLEVSLSTKENYKIKEIEGLDRLEEKIKKECKNHKNIHYWGVSPDFNYYNIKVIYSDAQGNIDYAYYIYKKEYMTDWNLYKISEKENESYTENILYKYNETNKEDKKIIKGLFSNKNFKSFEDSKYDQMWEWVNMRQFQ